MLKVAFFQIVYINTTTTSGKNKVTKKFVFLEEIEKDSTIELIKECQKTFNRYKNLSNVITIDFDIINNGYIFNKSKLVSLKLETIKGTSQSGEKVELKKRW